MERNKELRESVKSALIYPVILVGVAVVSVALLLVWVVPQFETTFAQAGKALPLPTLVVVAVGKFMRAWWWALLGHRLPGVHVVPPARARPRGTRRSATARLLDAPLLGDLIAKVETARFARTLSTLLGNGVTLLSGLAIVKETMSNTVMANALDGVIAKLREGQGLRPAARRHRPVSAARVADDPGRRGVRAAGGDADARGGRLRPRGAARRSSGSSRCSSRR